MANFEISDAPGLNISAVKEVVQSDKVIASLINQYFKIFLSNDQALKNLKSKLIGKNMVARLYLA